MLSNCDIDDHTENGMLSDLYKNQIGSRSFLQRFMYCFSWGLKCLSSMWQNFDTSASVVEAIISFTMTICGLVLFVGLIAQMQLPFFANMDHELAHAFVGHLEIFSCSKEIYLVIEGEPVKRILFILSGKLEISSINVGSSKSTLLRVGGLCGSESLAWASLPFASIQNLPCSSQSVKCLTDVEAFSLCAKDLKLLGIQFNNCWKFQQSLR